MARVRAAWRWLRSHWHLPALALALVLGWVLSRRVRDRAQVVETLGLELEASRAAQEALRLRAELGAERAVARVEADYHQELEALDERQRQEAGALRQDPVALSRFLVRAGSRRSPGA